MGYLPYQLVSRISSINSRNHEQLPCSLFQPYHLQVRAILVASPLRETSLATDRGARNTALHLAAESVFPSGRGDRVSVWAD